jgi:hypothetical protein
LSGGDIAPSLPYQKYEPTTSAVKEWTGQSERTCSSGATVKVDEPGPPGVCSGLLS